MDDGMLRSRWRLCVGYGEDYGFKANGKNQVFCFLGVKSCNHLTLCFFVSIYQQVQASLYTEGFMILLTILCGCAQYQLRYGNNLQ